MGGNSCQKLSFSYPSIFHHVVLNLSSTGRFSINIIWLNFTTLQEMIFSNSTGRFFINIIWLKFTTLQEINFSNFIQLKFTRKSLYSIWILNCYHCCLNTMPLFLNLSPSNTYPPTLACVSTLEPLPSSSPSSQSAPCAVATTISMVVMFLSLSYILLYLY